jgi:hypothetical protein
MTEEDVKNGRCGKKGVPDKIIPPDAIHVPNDAFVYEFTSQKHIDAKGKYIPQYPGLSKSGEKFFPCCFKTPNKNISSLSKKSTKTPKKGKASKSAQSKKLEPILEEKDENEEEEEENKPTPQTDESSENHPIRQSEKNKIRYIKSNETFPITEIQRFGFLPLSIQRFFQYNNYNCVLKTNPAYIRPNVECLLRYSVEQKPRQSILGVFADIYASSQSLDETPSVDEFKEILKENIGLDRFIRYNNSNLISIFKKDNTSQEKTQTNKQKRISTTKYKTTIEPQQYEDIDISKYTNTAFYKKIDLENNYQERFLKETIASYENFIDFLMSDDSAIDHTYLWDIITEDNPKITKNGINLVILEIAEDDVTDNISILCPSNTSANNVFDLRKRTAFVIKKRDAYEPICLYKDTTETIVTKKTFLEISTMEEIKKVMRIINRTMRDKCRPLPSISNKVYTFQKGLFIQDLFIRLKKYNFVVFSQIMNYQGKMVGVLVKRRANAANHVFVPCRPSSQMDEMNDIPFLFMDETTIPDSILQKIKQNINPEENVVPTEKTTGDAAPPLENTASILSMFSNRNRSSAPTSPTDTEEIDNEIQYNTHVWMDYETTIRELKHIHIESRNSIPCSPKLKVIEDGLIVGVITETNQFVQIDPPTEDIYEDDFPTVHQSNTYIADKELAISQMEDPERKKTVSKIYLQTQFFVLFRTIVREVLNALENRKVKQKIMDLFENPFVLSSVKERKIIFFLKQLVGKRVEFAEFDEDVLYDICSTDNKNMYCIKRNGRDCVLLIPENHLLQTGVKNTVFFYQRLANDLLHNMRVRLFMTEPNNYLNVTDTDYKINRDEFILLQSTLQGDYLKNQIPFNKNNQIQNITYDTAQPQITKLYTKEPITLKEQTELATEDNTTTRNLMNDMNENILVCIEETRTVMGNNNSLWKRIFSKKSLEKTEEKVFKNANGNCTFYILIYIFQNYYKKPISLSDLKKSLINGYKRFWDKHFAEMKIVWTKQGKDNFAKKVTLENLPEMILDQSYYLSDIDIWIFSIISEIQICIFNTNKLRGIGIEWCIMGKKYDRPHYFIRTGSFNRANKPMSYHLITPAHKLAALGELDEMVKATISKKTNQYKDNLPTFEEYLQKYNI